jgi:CBS domain-containing protein
MLDIKTRGICPFVDFARVLALRYGIRETNTLERLRLLMLGEKISKDLYHSAVEAYELQMQLRVIQQLGQIENGNDPDNFIRPAQLSDLEKRMLRDAFAVIERMQNELERIFPEA